MRNLDKIAIIGPESTGKSLLTKELARYFNANSVSEYSRDYFENREYKYEIEDLISIAKGQLCKEENIANSSSGLLFCDTDILTIKIWSHIVFNTVPDWIDEKVKTHTYQLYLLCNTDIEWESDRFRKNDHNRQYIYNLFVKELERYNLNYRVVKGKGGVRLVNAVSFLEEFLKNG